MTRRPSAKHPRKSSEPVRLREYERADFRSVRRLWREEGLILSPSDSCIELERARRRDPDLFLVAEEGARIVGVVLGRFDGRRGWMNHLAVASDVRSQGIGTRLVRELERRLLRKGCPKVNLHVVPNNEEVCRFYESLGYRRGDLLFLDKWLRRAPAPDRTTRRGPSAAPRARSPRA